MDWENVFNNIGFWYDVFIEWYLDQPIYGQVLAIIGLIALCALAITLVYYMIKGIAYLLYYMFKGIYLLLKYIGYGFYKLTEGFYYLVSGKPKPSKKESSQKDVQNDYTSEYQYNLEYCSECGRKMSQRMKYYFEKNGIAYCEKCGTRLTQNHALRIISISH